MMRWMQAALLTALAVQVLGASAVHADDGCRLGCGAGAVACMAEAQTVARACREVCRADGGGPSCRRACRDGFAAARATCRGAVSTCGSECPPPSSDNFRCAGDCGAVGANCLQDLVRDGKACVRTCRAAGGRLPTCLAECAGSLGGGRDACRAAVDECRMTCKPPDGGASGCAQACVETTRTCAAPSFPALRSCARGCRFARAMFSLDCLRQCATTMCDCLHDLRRCLEPCGSADGAFVDLPTGVLCGSPSGAFVD